MVLKFRNLTKGSALFNFIRIKYKDSWRKVKNTLKPYIERRERLEKALDCYYNLTIKDTYIHLYKNVCNVMSFMYMIGDINILMEKCCDKLYKLMFLKKCTNYFDIYLEMYDKLGYGSIQLSKYDNNELKLLRKFIKRYIIDKNVVLPDKDSAKMLDKYEYVKIEYDLNHLINEYLKDESLIEERHNNLHML